ncbi:hypothetical protein EJB05_54749, partial [Eragrostis curvula]
MKSIDLRVIDTADGSVIRTVKGVKLMRTRLGLVFVDQGVHGGRVIDHATGRVVTVSGSGFPTDADFLTCSRSWTDLSYLLAPFDACRGGRAHCAGCFSWSSAGKVNPAAVFQSKAMGRERRMRESYTWAHLGQGLLGEGNRGRRMKELGSRMERSSRRPVAELPAAGAEAVLRSSRRPGAEPVLWNSRRPGAEVAAAGAEQRPADSARETPALAYVRAARTGSEQEIAGKTRPTRDEAVSSRDDGVPVSRPRWGDLCKINTLNNLMPNSI